MKTKKPPTPKPLRGFVNVYHPRPCKVCGNEAAYAVNVMARTVGRGQGRRTRKLKLGVTVLLCESCARSDNRLDHLDESAVDSFSHVLRPSIPNGPGLFEQAGA
jgi:hypothetical protein